jgi:hypothetical protein
MLVNDKAGPERLAQDRRGLHRIVTAGKDRKFTESSDTESIASAAAGAETEIGRTE